MAMAREAADPAMAAVALAVEAVMVLAMAEVDPAAALAMAALATVMVPAVEAVAGVDPVVALVVAMRPGSPAHLAQEVRTTRSS